MTLDEQAVVVTGTAQRQAWRDRVLPPVERVRPGLWSVPTPFPHNPLRYVLAYLAETPGGIALVDTGWPSEDAWDGLVQGIRQTGHELADVTAVLVTHGHADHFGLARRVREASGAWIGMHPLDAQAMRSWSSLAEFVEVDTAWLISRGVPPADIGELLPAGDGPREGMGPPDVLVEDGARPLGEGALRAIWTPGHTPGHLCFLHEGCQVMLTGDHLLPRISPNISSSPRVTDDVLADFLRSLYALTEHDVTEVLPAHEYRFAGLPARVRQLHEHHRARLREVLAVIAELPGCTTLDVAQRLTWSRPWRENRGLVRRIAIGETYAHLVHLERRGLVDSSATGADHWRLSGPTSAVADVLSV